MTTSQSAIVFFQYVKGEMRQKYKNEAYVVVFYTKYFVEYLASVSRLRRKTA